MIRRSAAACLVMCLIMCLVTCLGQVSSVISAPIHHSEEIVSREYEPDIVGPIPALPSKANADTLWIANWTFDSPGGCDDTGWTTIDAHFGQHAGGTLPPDLNVYWQVDSGFDGVGNLTGQAAVLTQHDLCWVFPDGYANNWHQGIRFEYSGLSYLSFDYLVDSEPGFDFLSVSVDSACASFDLAVPAEAPGASFRNIIWQVSGLDSGHVDSLALSPLSGANDCAYIEFFSDGGFAASDGLYEPTFGVASVVDNIVVEGATNLSENFEGPLSPDLTFVLMQDLKPFGNWGRLFPHITDNDICTENNTCAWLFTDYTTPTLAYDPSMDFGPGGYVTRRSMEEHLFSPWVSLASTPNAFGTVVKFRRFPGQVFAWGQVVQRVSLAGRYSIDNTDTPELGDSLLCVEAPHFGGNSMPTAFAWITETRDRSGLVEPHWEEVQVRFRTSDWGWIAGASDPVFLNPGPGPYVDDVRVGRLVVSGPHISVGDDSRTQAQDAFATAPVMWSGPPSQESFAPSATRFGTAAFSMGADLAPGFSSNLITGDSITVEVMDLNGAGGITAVELHAAIVEGPHAGQAPPPHVVVGDFFVVAAETSLTNLGQVVPDRYFVDLDDDYFLGGDVLHYLWLASDASAATSSNPAGLSAAPSSLAQAQQATNGLFEVTFLPQINWDSDILALAQTGDHGKITQAQLESPDPSWTDEFGAVGEQANCILYYQNVNSARRSGDLHRTTFMYTLDHLGYQDQYDVYDHQGLGNTNNQLGGRASVGQAEGYALIIYDAGNRPPDGLIMPATFDKVDQASWFQAYLFQGIDAEVGIANLWLIGSNAVEERPSEGLYTTEMGVGFVSANQGLSVNPEVEGQTDFTYTNGNNVDFSSDEFVVQGGCPTIRDYDGLSAGSGVATHAWRNPSNGSLGDAAMVQNSNPARSHNTVLQAFPLFDMRALSGLETPVDDWVSTLLGGLLPEDCNQSGIPTPVPEARLPRHFALSRAYPNPFNPVTSIRFSVPKAAEVTLTIYDVAGRRIKQLAKADYVPGHYQETWNGLDAAGRHVASGIYFVRMHATEGFQATQKLVLTK